MSDWFDPSAISKTNNIQYMETKKILSIAVFLLSIFCLIDEIEETDRNRTLEDNLQEIDQRITALEQSQCITDSALVVALQSANEALYEIKIK